jgi:uncharacterized membrane protein YsdA (DUF1294 family)/cold shock CspA family protein
MRITGKISRWQDDKGFGFIEPTSGGPQVFLHASALQNRYRRPVSGDVVIFSRETDQKGRFQAHDVVFAGETPKPKQPLQQNKPGPWRPKYWQYGLSAAFLVLLIAGAVEKYWGWKIIVYYCIASIVTFAMYSSDKFAAEQRNSRTPESTLQCLSLLGGWPGALVAQNFLRHKSRKTKFLILFWLMVFGNLVALYMLCFSFHAADIRMVLGI